MITDEAFGWEEQRREFITKRTLYTIQDIWKGMLEYVLNKKDLLDAAQLKKRLFHPNTFPASGKREVREKLDPSTFGLERMRMGGSGG